MTSLRSTTWLAALFVAGWFASPAHALIIYGANDTSFNTTAPTGTYASSGWDYEGAWGIGGGTAIAPNYFITAKHFTPAVDQSGKRYFVYAGQSYEVAALYDDPNSDLRVCRINGTFPVGSWAPLYTGSSEVGQTAVIFGRGSSRGTAVTVAGANKGWAADSSGQGTMRWGTNTITGLNGTNELVSQFDATGGPNEATLGDRDSGSGVFIQDADGVWKLAGVNYAIEGPFDVDSDHTSGVFFGGIYDRRGLYEATGGTAPNYTWSYIPTRGNTPLPASFYLDRISSELGWINKTVFAASCDGNNDGIVDGSDFLIWQTGYGKPANGPASGDFNLDGVVDGSDFLAWQVNYGTVLNLATGTASAPALPEPATLLLLTAGATGLLRRRK